MKKVIIVGATSGLGRGIAETYIARGWQVAITGRRTVLLAEVAGAHPNVVYDTLDVTDTARCIKVLESLTERLGGLDLLVLSSGVGRQNAALDFDLELPTIETNVRGWTAIADWTYKLFAAQGHGHLAAISSIASVRGLAPAPAYSASKAYQAHYLEALRQRAMVSGRPIYVSDIRPGFVDTPLLANPKQFFWVLPPEKAVRAIVRAIDRRRGVATITCRWALIAPIMRLLPTRLLAHFIAK